MQRALSLVAFVLVAPGCSSESSNPAPEAGNGAANASTTTAPKDPTKGTPRDSETVQDDGTTTAEAPIDCTGDDGTFYGLEVTKLGGGNGSQLPLCAYKDTVVLIVNGASGCGYTPQYKPLEALYAKYGETQKQKFAVLAFPSDSFNQEKDTDQAVSEFCTSEYHITFPLTTIGPVIDDATKGVSAQPVYQWLYRQPGNSAPVSWNFEKFLIGKDGKLVKRWLSATSPDEGGEIDLAIAAELAK